MNSMKFKGFTFVVICLPVSVRDTSPLDNCDVEPDTAI